MVIVERVLAQLVDRVVIQELVAEIDAVLDGGRRLEELPCDGAAGCDPVRPGARLLVANVARFRVRV